MFKHLFVVGILAFFLLSVQLLAQNQLLTTFYVSSGSGGQILAINPNASPATVTVIFPTPTVVTTSPFVPEEMVVGPDGNLWVCNTTGNQILRLRLNPALPTAAVTAFQTVFDNSGGDLTKPTQPEGCSFVSTFAINNNVVTPASLDLYFTARAPNCSTGPCAGVWKIAAAASVDTNGAGTFNAPTSAIPGLTSKAEGIEFDKLGNLQAVDNAGNRVMRGLPPNPYVAPPLTSFNCGSSSPNCASPFIPASGDVSAAALSGPTGVAVNTCGDILVADSGHSALKRYSKITGKFEDQLGFSTKDTPRYVECDTTNTCYVATGDELGDPSSDGKVWMIRPPVNDPNHPQMTSCALPANTSSASLTDNTVVQLVDLKHLAGQLTTGSTPLSGIANALGVAAPATMFTTPTHTFTPQSPSFTFVLGHHNLFVQCMAFPQAKPFNMSVTAVQSRPPELSPTANNPTEVTFTSVTLPFACSNANGTMVPVPTPITCGHYSSFKGFCTQYLERTFDPNTSLPITDFEENNQYCSSFKFGLSTNSLDFPAYPGVAHNGKYDLEQNALVPPSIADEATDPFNQCVSHDFYTVGGPEDTPLYTGRGTNSKHVAFNGASACSANPQATINSPVASCTTKNGVTTCKPQFNIGQNVAVKITLTCGGKANTTAVERLSITRIFETGPNCPTGCSEAVPQEVVSTKNSSVDNFMNVNSTGVYSYNVDSSFFDQLPGGTTAVYKLIMWGNGIAPVQTNITGAQ